MARDRVRDRAWTTSPTARSDGPVRRPVRRMSPARCWHDDRMQKPALWMGWLTLVLVLDRHAALGTQRLLGAATWVVLLLALRTVSTVVRAQTAVVVAFATVVEYLASPTLHVYDYRLGNVPTFVPPGHGLVYLSAYVLGHELVRRGWLRRALVVAVVGLGGWTLWGVAVADRSDALGGVWFGCLVGFLLWGPSRPVYVGAAFVVTWLELAGTGIGTWAWRPQDPVGLLSVGNPPSGAPGGYGWFDLAGLLVAPWLLRAWAELGRNRSASSRAQVEDGADPALTLTGVELAHRIGDRIVPGSAHAAEEPEDGLVGDRVRGQRFAAGRAVVAVE